MTQPAVFDLDKSLHWVAHWLPSQGPVKDFIHHNTLHSFQHLHFHDGISAGARLYGARPYMPIHFYVSAFRSGSITETALNRALKEIVLDDAQRQLIRERMLSDKGHDFAFPGIARSGLRALWTQRLGDISLDRLSHSKLFRLIGGYLDQGLSLWRMPGADKIDFFTAVASLIEDSGLPLHPLDAPGARELMKLPAREAAMAALKKTVGDEKYFERYLLETFLSQPGWSGLVAQCEAQPASLLSPRHIHFMDYAAVTLVSELGCLEHLLGNDFEPIARFIPPLIDFAVKPESLPDRKMEEVIFSIWSNAFEWSYYESLLGGVMGTPKHSSHSEQKMAWAFFCIDDRECSFRRHIEESDPKIETYATAGFFGLDFMYQGAADSVASKHCPLPVVPKHLVIEEIGDVLKQKRKIPLVPLVPWWKRMLHLESQSNTFFRGWILSHALGLGAAIRLAASVFRPSLAPVSVPPLSTVNQNARLRLTRNDRTQTKEGLWLGYSAEELADRVHGVLHSVGAESHWPELIVFFAHGSSSVNNPYFAAYDCGACSGRQGAPNARAFADAANMPEVREILKARGVEIPEQTWFIGAMHDTSRDSVTYFDINRIPKRLKPQFDSFRKSIERALPRNAAERCRRFEAVPEGVSPRKALHEVRSRAVSLFEPRPEYNHATNASCIVGRRNVTEGLFLDRRAFLNSYDPTKDPDGEILASILSAVIPVCGGINLEYFFSRVDPQVYGAGSKLPHNVTGLIGLCNGIEGDLLTGLPTQMTEIHDPVRLLILVEQKPEIALAAVLKNPTIAQWVENEWVRFACLDPIERTISLLTRLDNQIEMRKIEGLRSSEIHWANSLDAAHRGRGNIPVGIIDYGSPY